MATFQRDIFQIHWRDHNNVLGIQIQAQFMEKYNYLLAAALDTGLNLSILLIFLFFSAGKTVNFPNGGATMARVWRCFAMS